MYDPNKSIFAQSRSVSEFTGASVVFFGVKILPRFLNRLIYMLIQVQRAHFYVILLRIDRVIPVARQ